MNPYQRTKRFVFKVIQPSADASGGIASLIFDIVIMTLIVSSILSVFICTFHIPDLLKRVLFDLEFLSLVIFAFEYVLRLWTADLLYPDLGPLSSRLRYMASAMAIVDLVSILPFVLMPLHLLPYNLVGVRIFRLVRLFRIFKLNRYSDAVASIGEVIRSRSQQMIASVFFVFIILILASLLIYYAECEAQPDAFKNAFSGLWWAVATLTTVGYGDICPITPLGRVLGAIIAILGIGMVAIPTSILSAGFMEMLEKKNAGRKNAEEAQSSATGGAGTPAEKPAGAAAHRHGPGPERPPFEPPQYCPHCGKRIYPWWDSSFSRPDRGSDHDSDSAER